ncbi:amidohydrolase family protein [Humibacter antri]
MIIDTHVHPTNLVDQAWRHTGEPFTGERAMVMMDGPFMVNGKPRRVDIACAMPPPGNTQWKEGDKSGREGIRNYQAHVSYLVQNYPDRFIGNFIYNPRFGPENGAEELRFHVQEYGYKMMKLHANMHSYRPDRALDWLRPALKVCDELGVIVLLHTGDGPYSIPTQFYPIIREFPNVKFIIGHFGVQTGGVYCFEAFWMIQDSPNVYGESGWLLQSRIVEFAKDMKKSRLVYGTDSPPNEPGMWMRELEVLGHEPPQGLNTSEDDLEGYLGNNMAKLLGLQPTPAPKDVAEAEAYLRGDIPQASADNRHAEYYKGYTPDSWADDSSPAELEARAVLAAG